MAPKIYDIPTGEYIDRSNPVADAIEAEIMQNGGLTSFSRYMQHALYSPRGGYYSGGKARINQESGSDFITATHCLPFNQTIGNFALQTWRSMGEPGEFHILEQGAGTGIMAKDILVAARNRAPDFYRALQYLIVEPGDMMRQQQKTIIDDVLHKSRARSIDPEGNRQDETKVQWIKGSALELPLQNDSIEGLIVSNELPDAFPVEVIRNFNGELKQKYVTLRNNEWVEVWQDLAPDVQKHVEKYTVKLDRENIEEPINLHAAHFFSEMDRALRRGATLTIDYGNYGSAMRDPRAIRRFPYAFGTQQDYQGDPNNYIPRATKFGNQLLTRYLKKQFGEYTPDIGEFDLTADIDFEVLGLAAHTAGHSAAVTSQDDFLYRFDFPRFASNDLIGKPMGVQNILRQQQQKLIEGYGNFKAMTTLKDIPSSSATHPLLPLS